MDSFLPTHHDIHVMVYSPPPDCRYLRLARIVQSRVRGDFYPGQDLGTVFKVYF